MNENYLDEISDYLIIRSWKYYRIISLINDILFLIINNLEDQKLRIFKEIYLLRDGGLLLKISILWHGLIYLFRLRAV